MRFRRQVLTKPLLNTGVTSAITASCYKRALELASCAMGAGDGARTRDSLLGKQELYH